MPPATVFCSGIVFGLLMAYGDGPMPLWASMTMLACLVPVGWRVWRSPRVWMP